MIKKTLKNLIWAKKSPKSPSMFPYIQSFNEDSHPRKQYLAFGEIQ